MAVIRELEAGIWLDDAVLSDDTRRDVESLCRLLSDCVADLVVSLSMFEHAQIASRAHMQALAQQGHDHEQWERDGQRRRAREAELEAEAGIAWGGPDYFEKAEAIREQVRREMLREKWEREGGPEAYKHRVPFIHAQSFVSTLAVLQRSLVAIAGYAFDVPTKARLQEACNDFAAALPGLKDVRDSIAHIEERVRTEARGAKIKTQPVTNSMVHAPQGGVTIINALNNQHFGGTIADGTYVEVEVADATTEVAGAAVQAVFDALPWKPGHRRVEPSY